MIHSETRIATPVGMVEALHPSRIIRGFHIPSLSFGKDTVTWKSPDRSYDPDPVLDLITVDGFGITASPDQKILVSAGPSFEWVRVENSMDRSAVVCLGFGQDIGKPGDKEIATRSGIISCNDPVLPVWMGDSETRECWVRGVIEGFAVIDKDRVRLPYSHDLQTILLSIGIPSSKDHSDLVIHPFWLGEFCQIIQPSSLKSEMNRVLNSTTQLDDHTPRGSRVKLRADSDLYNRQYAKTIFLSKVTSVSKAANHHGYSWESDQSTGIVANGLIIGA